MGFRFDSPVAKALGLGFAAVALAGFVFQQSTGFRLDALGSHPLELALGIAAVLVVGALWIFTDDAFQG